MERPIRVIVFGGGPVLERGVKQFICRLEDHPEIEFLGCICQSKGHTYRDMVRDLWRRRGLLAIPLLLSQAATNASRFLTQPRRELNLKRKLAKVSSRIHYVADIHADPVLEQVRLLAPDLGLIYGSPILKPKLFEIPACGTLGIHHGKAPEYRGKKTMFWAMYNGEEAAGVTIQKVNAGLDTGEIVKQTGVPIGHRTPGAVWSELNELGLNLYIQAILEVKQGTAQFRPQTGIKGKLYRDPSPGDVVELWRRIVMRMAKDWLRISARAGKET